MTFDSDQGQGSGNLLAGATINAAGNGFEVRVQNPSDAVLSNYTVQYVAVEAGVYTSAEHGITMEAVKYSSTVTGSRVNWASEARSYQQSYANPVVVGQVMTANDPDWSVFWANNGTRPNPPSASSLSLGKHVAEDTDTTRSTETVAYLVIEAVGGAAAGLNCTAGVTADSIEGILQSAPYVTNVGGQYASGVVSSVGMDGNNGGWPVLYGSNPLAGGQLDLGIDEDQIRDSERSHITEEVAYFLLQ